MRLAIITIAIGEHYQRLSTLTHPTIQRYADRIGADFIAITEQKIFGITQHWEKFQLLDYLNDYDRILYIDTDVLIRKNCPNIFDIVPETHLGIYNEAPFIPGCDYAIHRCAEACDAKEFKWNGKYYNTGVMVLSRRHRLLLRKPENEIFKVYEQSYLNLVIQRMKPQIFEIDYKFNRMSCVDKVNGKNRFESYIIHYAGVNCFLNGFGIIQNDLSMIESLPDDYVSPKYIWINIQGGLGDQMQAEPTIRFAIQHVWKGADLRISADFPELFTHLPVICKKHGEQVWENLDTEPFCRGTWLGPDMVSHTVDSCSLAVLSRILPDIDKSCQLQVDPAALESVKNFAGRNGFEDCVLVHAGRHWESKTFPESWWQSVVDGIIDAGLTPVLIGKDLDETCGVLKLDGRGKSIDLTNMLNIKELIAVVSLVPVLVSNDSSPIHLAGAFDNWIVLIPTCKHPDHILPYRNGSKSYKTRALYKKLALDDISTSTAEMRGSGADQLPGKWEDYLPDASSVLQTIQPLMPRNFN